MFTFQVTRLHERHLSVYRLQGVSPLPHAVRRGAREREGESTVLADGSVGWYVRTIVPQQLFQPGSPRLFFCAIKVHRAIRDTVQLCGRIALRSVLWSFLLLSLHGIECTSWLFTSFFGFNIIGWYSRGRKDICEKEERMHMIWINYYFEFILCASTNIYFL